MRVKKFISRSKPNDVGQTLLGAAKQLTFSSVVGSLVYSKFHLPEGIRMIDICLYCKQDDNVAQTYVVYNESYSDSSEMRLLAFVGGNIGSGNFDTEWCLINFNADGNPVSALVAEECDGTALVEIKRSYVFDQDEWSFVPAESPSEPEIDQEIIDRIQSVNKRWIEFDEGDRLIVSDLMSYQFENSDEATVGDLDEDQLAWLAKIWSLRA